ncbi:MAG: hypothetical protein ABIA63_02840 [bacterium]
MKRSPEEDELYRRLKPSRFSGSGFLGNDNRSLEEIIDADLQMLNKLGISKEELADNLIMVFKRAKSAFGAEVTVTDSTKAIYYESRGRIPSPFKGDGVFEKGIVMVKNIKMHKEIVITSLSINLVEKYGFFQGIGSPYRINPEIAVLILGLRKN